jgi:hypothetical protein
LVGTAAAFFSVGSTVVAAAGAGVPPKSNGVVNTDALIGASASIVTADAVGPNEHADEDDDDGSEKLNEDGAKDGVVMEGDIAAVIADVDVDSPPIGVDTNG